MLLFTHPLRRSARIHRTVQYNLSACEAAFTCMLVPIQLDMMRPVTLIIVTQQHVMYPYLSPTETTDHEKIAFQHTRELFVDFENLIPEKVLVVKSTKVGPSDDDLECLGGPSSLCFLDKENRVGMYLGSQVTQPCHFLLNTSVGVLLLVICNDKLFPSECS